MNKYDETTPQKGGQLGPTPFYCTFIKESASQTWPKLNSLWKKLCPTLY